MEHFPVYPAGACVPVHHIDEISSESKGRFRMKHLLFLLPLLLLCCMLSAAAAEDPGYTIRDYHFEGLLQPDNVMQVQETLVVDFAEPSHGIIRNISNIITFDTSLYGGTDTNHYKAKVERLSVDGAPFSLSGSTDYTEVRIGDKKKEVTGQQQYMISYNYAMPDDRISDYDILFYSVLGSEVTAKVDHFSFNVTFQKPLPDEAVENFSLFSGRFGNIYNTRDVVYTIDANHVEGEVSGLQPGDAVTLFAPVPGSYFEGARKPSAIPGMLFAALSIALGLSALLKALFTHHEKVEPVVGFYPPEGMSSAEAGYILSGKATDSVILSLVPYWAGKGFLTAEESQAQTGKFVKHDTIALTLTKMSDLPVSAPQHEKTLFDAIFTPGVRDTFVCETDSTYSFVQKLDEARSQLAALFSGDRALLKNVEPAWISVITVNIAYFLLLTFCGAISPLENVLYGLYSLFPLGTLGILSVSRGCKPKKNIGGTILFVIGAVFLLGISGGTSYICAFEDCLLPPKVILAAFTAVALFNLFVGRMICPSDYKLSVAGQLEGFREFIKSADASRIQLLFHDNPVYYYDIMPYAMAFDLMDEWSCHFETYDMEPPYWYYGYMGRWNHRYMHRAMHEGLRNPVSHTRSEHASSSSSSSSHGGGGGYSGGGGGGGGVSRW